LKVNELMNMKKLVVFFALLALPFALLANTVSAEKAKAMATQFFYPSGMAPASSLTLVWNGEDAMTKSTSSPAFYVFAKDGGGFVMISGDDALPAILAYSDKSDFPVDKMPEHVSAWFAEIRNYIQTGRKNGLASGYVDPSWSSTNQPDMADPVISMSTPNWGQGYPYNAANGNGWLTGCVATAMSEILWYHRYPTRGTGTVPAYTTESLEYSIPAHDLGVDYLWDKMPSSYGGNWTAENIEQVSRLMYDCGTIVQMDYSSNSSGAFSSDVPVALIKYMGIDKSAYFVGASFYTTDEWTAKLRAELDKERPLYYSARDVNGNGGHAFVLDGYDTDGNFHINFGWNGNYNAYYTFPDFKGSSYVFSKYHATIFNLFPNAGGEPEPMIGFEPYYSSDRGLYVYDAEKAEMRGKFTPGDSYSANLEGILYNVGSFDFSGFISFVRENANGVPQELCCSEPIEYKDLLSTYGDYNMTLDFTVSKIDEGDELKLYYKSGAKSTDLANWKPVLCQQDYEGFNTKIDLVLDEGALANKTSVSYTVADKTLYISTLSDATFTFTNSAGSGIQTGVSASSGKITIDTSKLEAGKYTLTLKWKQFTKTLVFNIGK